MEHNIGDYFNEMECDDVHGFAIIGTVPSSNEYHLAEKWYPSSDDEKWSNYHISADVLAERLANGDCEHTGFVSDEQMERICEKFDHSEITAEQILAQ